MFVSRSLLGTKQSSSASLEEREGGGGAQDDTDAEGRAEAAAARLASGRVLEQDNASSGGHAGSPFFARMGTSTKRLSGLVPFASRRLASALDLRVQSDERSQRRLSSQSSS
eukprot:2571524-Prymnesium_polylepis.1